MSASVATSGITQAQEDLRISETNVATGPDTEQRFPPLIIPDGFQATLFACDPLIEYPSVIAIGPQAGSLFVAHDYMTGLGLEIVRRDEVRLVEDTDADGYADRSTVYAGEFNSIQGLAFHDGSVFVMHAPLLTRLCDTDGDGIADERRDLIQGLGLPPEENNNRLHCANGVVAGHDGWLYLALGDRGCDVQRPEGDRLLFQQGGILRCRIDGSDLHVFSTGLRNIYDVALDEELNVFVRDNENDGGDYMIRVCHCFFGSDHGYPYHYLERPDEPMQPLADLGRGSSAGGTAYLETMFPAEYRDSLFFCEWGRGVVRYHRTRQASSFELMTETDFATGAKDDPYGFKPTDLVVDRDGSMLVADWCDGQRPKRGRGRIYRISFADSDAHQPHTGSRPDETESSVLIKQLDGRSYQQRIRAQLELQRRGSATIAQVISGLQAGELDVYGRLHAIWIIAQSSKDSATEFLFDLATSDSDPRVRAQAVRAIGDLTDPVLVNNRINSAHGDPDISRRVAEIANDADPRIILEALLVMRRLTWAAAPEWMADHLSIDDPAVAHASQQTLRNCSNWSAVVRLLDDVPRFRKVVLHAIAELRIGFLAEQLIQRVEQAENPEHRREYADALTRIVRKTAPWTYWGFRPAARPPAIIDWESTTAIERALNGVLADPDLDVRNFVLGRMIREGIEPEIRSLARWLSEDTCSRRVNEILEVLRNRDSDLTSPILLEVIQRTELSDSSRLAALSMLVEFPADISKELIHLMKRLEDGSVLASTIRETGIRPDIAADHLLLKKLDSKSSIIRAEAIRALGKRGCKEAALHVERLINDADEIVRLAAVEAIGQIGVVRMSDLLLDFAAGDNDKLTSASLNSLRQLRDSRAVSAASNALEHHQTQFAGIEYLNEFGTPDRIDFVAAAAAHNPASDFQSRVVQTLVTWQNRFPDSHNDVQRAIATIHGHSGQPLAWNLAGPFSEGAAERLLVELNDRNLTQPGNTSTRLVIAEGSPATVSLQNSSRTDSVWLAWTSVLTENAEKIEIMTSASGYLNLWLDGHQIYIREQPARFQPDSDRISTRLNPGTSRLVARVQSGENNPVQFHLRFRRRSSKAEHEQLMSYALASDGDVDRGRAIFRNAEKSSCIRCHRLGSEGGRIGPDLTGIGNRFSRVHLIESILEPSRTVAPSYATVIVVLTNGKVMTGIPVSKSDKALVLGDNQGKLHQIASVDIQEIVTQAVSTMPEGLEKKLTRREFVDLLAFLESEKSARNH
ncbi:MAG: HEAT repeat domain-containing protein [Fuerstiella sp.]|nr:HEAT repeat domain-containing protein [Fuerstiella sp.]